MPRTRRTYKKRSTRRRVHLNPVKRYISTKRNVKWGRIANDVRMLKGLINTEIKYVDTYMQSNDNYWVITASPTVGVPAAETGPPTSGYLWSFINYPNQGDDFNEREGRSIKMKSMQLKGRIALSDASSTSSGYCRVMILLDKQCQIGEITDPVPILYQTDVNGDYSLDSRVNRQQNKRYVVMSQRRYLIAAGNRPIIQVNQYIRLNDKIKFNGVASSNFMDKMFHIVVLTQAKFPQVGSNDINPILTAQLNTRITYIDN
jgi:hypothetical protein